MSANLDQFLQWLKPLNDSGLINTLGVIATFAAVFVALLPTIWKWKKRPKLTVLLKAVEIKNVTGDERRQPEISTTARILIKNVGGSAALNVRAVVTDLYIQTSEPLSLVWRDHGQKTLTSSDKDLPAGLSFPVSLIGRYQTTGLERVVSWEEPREFPSVQPLQALMSERGQRPPEAVRRRHKCSDSMTPCRLELILFVLWYLRTTPFRQHT